MSFACGRSAIVSTSRVSCGGAGKRSDVENARGVFKPKNCPNTPDVAAALELLCGRFPKLDVNALVSSLGGIDLLKATGVANPFEVFS